MSLASGSLHKHKGRVCGEGWGWVKDLVVFNKSIWSGNLASFCYQTRQIGPWSTVQKPFVYILQLTVHTDTVQMNWICRLGRYLLTGSLLDATALGLFSHVIRKVFYVNSSVSCLLKNSLELEEVLQCSSFFWYLDIGRVHARASCPRAACLGLQEQGQLLDCFRTGCQTWGV